MKTAGPDIITYNIDTLISKHKDEIPEEAVKELHKLRKHAVKGCLSDIAPGKGTFYNEMVSAQSFYICNNIKHKYVVVGHVCDYLHSNVSAFMEFC